MGQQFIGIEDILLKRPTLAQYAVLDTMARAVVDDCIKDYLKSNPVLRVGISEYKCRNLWALPWGELIDLRDHAEGGDMFSAMQIAYGIPVSAFESLEVFNVFACYKFMIDELAEIAKIEKQELGDEPDQELKDAGIDELARYGVTNAVDDLSGGDILKHSQVLKKPYAIVFQKMCLNKDRNRIIKTYNENAARKNKGNR